MSDQPDCIHQLDLCPTCHGLRVTRFDRLGGVSNVELDAGPFSFSGPAEVFVGPVAQDCPNVDAPEETP